MSRLVESRSRPPNRVTTGPEPGLLAAVAGRLVTVGRRPQGIAAGAEGHAERIKADRTGADLPADGTPRRHGRHHG